MTHERRGSTRTGVLPRRGAPAVSACSLNWANSEREARRQLGAHAGNHGQDQRQVVPEAALRLTAGQLALRLGRDTLGTTVTKGRPMKMTRSPCRALRIQRRRRRGLPDSLEGTSTGPKKRMRGIRGRCPRQAPMVQKRAVWLHWRSRSKARREDPSMEMGANHPNGNDRWSSAMQEAWPPPLFDFRRHCRNLCCRCRRDYRRDFRRWTHQDAALQIRSTASACTPAHSLMSLARKRSAQI